MTSDATIARIAITMGDPGGVGPEVIARALVRDDVRAACTAVVVGDAAVMNVAAHSAGLSLRFAAPTAPATQLPPGAVPVVECHPAPSAGYPVGRVDAVNGHAAFAWICAGVNMVRNGEADALVTAPIAKEAMFAAGFTFPGHTELLSELCGGCEVRMMLAGGGLRAVLETIHVRLASVPGLITTESLIRTIGITAEWGTRHVTPRPRIAVCGLNPHAGEAGHFGTEEADTILPAIDEARERGHDVSGPYPADTVFHRMRQGEFDFVVAMYHDQALIPVKTLDFHGGVNITLGLPIIRVSPDHGTAFNIAGRGRADASSMAAALLHAARYARCAADGA